jgi:hypothetical protein
MVFPSFEDMLRYVLDNKMIIEQYDIDFKKIPLDQPEIKSTEPMGDTVEENLKVKVLDFSDAPILEASLGDENILYVESYEAMRNLCGSGKITLFGRTIMSNLCEMDNEAHVTLNIDILEKAAYNVNFVLKLLSEKQEGKPSIQLKETLINESKTV